MAVSLYSLCCVPCTVFMRTVSLCKGDASPSNLIVQTASGDDTLYCLQEEEDKTEGQTQFTSKAVLPQRQKALQHLDTHTVRQKKEKTPHG